MSTIYQCGECDRHLCADCDGGQDSCPKCSRGPMCDECAAEHQEEHQERKTLEDDEGERG